MIEYVAFHEPKIKKFIVYRVSNGEIFLADSITPRRTFSEVPHNTLGTGYRFNDYLGYLTYLASRLNGLSKPAFVEVEVTTRCNLSCLHCHLSPKLKPAREYPLSTWIDFISSLRGKVVALIVTGGEPLLRKDLPLILRAAKQVGLVVKLLTNGTLLMKRIEELKEVLDPYIDIIQVSLDGGKKGHEALRGRGTYEIVLDSIRKASKYFQVEVSFTLNKVNESEALIAYKEVSKYGASAFHISITRPVGRCRVVTVNFSTYFKILEKLHEAEMKWGVPVYPKLNSNISLDSILKSHYTCPAGISGLYIAWNGDAYLCPILRGYLGLGNVFRNGLSRVWKNTGRIRKILWRNLKKTKCLNCRYLGICRGGCPGHSYIVYRTANAPDPLCDINTEAT